MAPRPLRCGVCAAWLGALATMDLLAGRCDDPPWAAELLHALAGRLAGLAVTDEVVERVTVVGDFELAVLALRRAKQRRTHAGSGDRLAFGDQRRSECGARPVPHARRSLVRREVVERDALAVDEDPSQARLGEIDLCSAR